MSKSIPFLVVFVVLSSLDSLVAEDVVLLKAGAKLRGLVLDHSSNDITLKLRTERGQTVPVLRDSVSAVNREPDEQARYQLAVKYLGDSEEGQFDLVLWCLANGMNSEAERHLQQVLQKNPEHAQARSLLDTLRKSADGEDANPTTSKPEAPANGDAGKKKKTSPVRTKDQVAKPGVKSPDWNKTVLRLIHELKSNNQDRIQQAEKELLEIKDPAALQPLLQVMGRTTQENQRRILQVIDAMPSSDTGVAVATVALLGPSPSARAFALEYLRRRDPVTYRKVFEQGLQSRVAELIDGSARAVSILGDMGAVPALIEALNSTANANGERTKVVFDYSSFGMRFANGSKWGERSRFVFVPVMRPMQHESVLEALKKVTGEDYGFDAESWRQWWSKSGKSKLTEAKTSQDDRPAKVASPLDRTSDKPSDSDKP